MRRSAVLLATAIAAGACGDNRGSEHDPARGAQPGAEPPAPTAPAPAAPPAPATPELEPLGPPLATQLAQPMAAASFEGWSDDGRRFAIRAEHGSDAEELGGADLLELVQVHDSMTGQMIASYRVERVVDDERNARARFAKAWAEALPREQWRQFRADNHLAGTTPHLTSPDGAWVLRAESDDEAPHDSSFAISTADDELTTRWSGFREALVRIAPRRERGPRVHVIATRAEQQYELLSFRPPWDYDLVNSARGDRPPSVEGRVSAYWSPAGDRVLLMVTHEAVGARTEHGDLVEVRFYVRALGPQIEVVDAGAGAGAAHHLAALLGASSLPVARISTEEHAGGVYYRGEEHAELARRIAALAGHTRVEPATDRSWAAVTIALSK